MIETVVICHRNNGCFDFNFVEPIWGDYRYKVDSIT